MSFAVDFWRYSFVSLLFNLTAILFMTPALSEAVVSNVARNLTCTVFHGGAPRTFAWNGNETHYLEIVQFNSNSRPYIECLLKNKSSAANILIRIINSAHEPQITRQQLNFSVEKSHNGAKFYFIFGNYTSNIKERSRLPIRIWILASESKQLLFEGILVQLGRIPSFSNSSLNHTSVQSFFQKTSWKFYRYPCIQGLVLIVPHHLSGVKYGFPLGIGFALRQLTILKWENITLGNQTNQSYNIAVHDDFLILHNARRVYLLQSGKDAMFKEAVFSFKIQQITSISMVLKCTNKRQIQWFELAVIFRLENSSLAVALGKKPHAEWKEYVFPEWISNATYVSAIIDIERRFIILAVNIGQPQKTMIVSFKVRWERNALEVGSRPTFIGRKLNNPKMKMIETIPAILIFDEHEVWLSTDAGYNFKRIFLSEDSTKIRTVQYLDSNNATLFILTSNSAIMYGSSVFKLSSLGRNQECIKKSQVLLASSRGLTLYIVCGSEVLNQTGTSHVLKLDRDALVIPSTIVHLINDFEMSIRVNYYESMRQFEQNFDDICNIQRFPYIYLCNQKVLDDSSIAVRRTMEIRKFINCSFELRQNITSFYFITVHNSQNGRCNLWTANAIGQTLAILDSRVSCWIYWLINDTTALANCSKHETIGRNYRVRATYASLIDSRGDESCEKRHMSFLATNQSGLLEVRMNETVVEIGKAKSYLRIFDYIGGLIMIDNKTYVKLVGNFSITTTKFNYICIIGGKIRSQKKKTQVLPSPTCRFSFRYIGLRNTTIFLDANEKVEFNISLTVTNEVLELPYIDEIPPLTIQLIEPSYVRLQVKSYMKSAPMHIRVLITQLPYINGSSLLTIYSTTQPTTCIGSLTKVTVHGTCPPGKRLAFEYPLSYSKQTWLYGNPVDREDYARIATLPYNYQPPSHLGKAIPLTPNIYNADPSKPMYRSSFKISRDMSKLKQCKGRSSRPQCGCTLDMMISVLPEQSDCIQRAYKISFEEEFVPILFFIDSAGKKSNLSFPYCLTEVNNREEFTISKAVSANCLSLQKKSSLKFTAPGLFHFKVTANKVGYTFCNLETYFLVFVASTNLPVPSKDLVRAMTAFCFGALILCTFWFHYYLK